MLRSWLRLFGSSAGVAFVVAAAQLGVAQATGIIAFSAVRTDDRWRQTLTWIAFLYLVAVLAGAAIGRRTGRQVIRTDSAGNRFIAALSAGVGAVAAIGLAWLPAHSARPPVSVHPELVVAMTASVAIAAGVLLAVAALAVAPVAGSLRAAIGWAWLLAAACVIAGVATHQPYPAPRLGAADAPSVLSQGWWSGPNVQVGAAVVLGLAVAAMARWADANRLGIAFSGLAGPLAITAAHLITDIDVIPLVALGAGFLASALVALPKGRSEPGRAPAAQVGQKPTAEQASTGLTEDDRDEDQPRPRHGFSGQPRHGSAPSRPGQHGGATGHARVPAAPVAAAAGSYPGATATHYPAAASTQPAPAPGPSPVTPAQAAQPGSGVYTASSAAPATPTIGRPPRSADEEYSNWLTDIGRTDR